MQYLGGRPRALLYGNYDPGFEQLSAMRDDETRPDAGSSGQVEVFETTETSRFRLLAGLAVIALGVFVFLALTLPEVFPPGWLEQLFGLAAGPPDLPRRLLGLLAGPLIAAVGVFC